MSGSEDELVEAVRARLADPPPPEPPFDPGDLGVPGLRLVHLTLEGLDLPAGRSNPPPSDTPADPAAVADAAAALGVTLPPLLVRLYTGVADGGFGPGDGAIPVRGLKDMWDEYAVEMVECEDLDPWPPGVVPFCQVDDTLVHCVDCGSPDGAVVGFEFDDLDPEAEGGLAAAMSVRAPSIEAWLREWLDDRSR